MSDELLLGIFLELSIAFPIVIGFLWEIYDDLEKQIKRGRVK